MNSSQANPSRLPGPDRSGGRSRGLGALVALGMLAVCVGCWQLPLPTEPADPTAQPAAPSVTLTGRGAQASVPFRTDAAGEVLLEVAGSAPGVSWQTPGRTSAVVSVFVDGRHVTDNVVLSAQPITRSFFLGALAAGEHTLRLLFSADRSPPGASSVTLSGIRFRVITPGDPAYVAAAHAPVLYGRAVTADSPGAPKAPFQNASTDTPLLAWHTDTPTGSPGHRLLEYTVLWSNEDGGTSAPALMARWGRTTDIEWVYRVEVDASGAAVPGTALFQAPEHAGTAFDGHYEGAHPMLTTCTLNNNVCDRTGDEAGAATGAPMRFALAAGDVLEPVTQARELMMDRTPWTYQVMAAEARREGRASARPVPFTQIHDPRDYLYLVVDKRTTGPVNTDAAWVGLAIGVRVDGDNTLYRSDQLIGSWSIRRDGQVAAAVRLPAGTTAGDVVAVEAIRVVGAGEDTGARVEMLGIRRGFLLGPDGLPGESFLALPASLELNPATPTGRAYPVS